MRVGKLSVPKIRMEHEYANCAAGRSAQYRDDVAQNVELVVELSVFSAIPCELFGYEFVLAWTPFLEDWVGRRVSISF